MFSAHLVFGDIDGSSDYPFVERIDITENFRRICLESKPKLNDHSFFEVNNDSVMIGFSNLDNFLSGNDVLRYVMKLHRKLHESGIAVSFGVNLIACVPEIDWSTCRGRMNDIKRIYMPDYDYELEGRIIQSRLTGDPLNIASRVLEVSKMSKNPICYSVTNGGHFNDFFNNGREINPIIVKDWDKLIPQKHVQFLNNHGIEDLYSLTLDTEHY